MVKLCVSFLLLLFIAILAVTHVALLTTKEALKQTVLNQLSMAASLKEGALEEWFNSQEGNFLLINHSLEFQSHAKTLLLRQPSDSEYSAAYTVLHTYLEKIVKDQYNLQEIFILANNSKVMFSTAKQNEGKYENFGNFTQLEPNTRIFMPNFYPSPATGQPMITLSFPILDETGIVLGLVAAHLNLERMDAVIRQQTGLGESGEIYLIGNFIVENAFITGRKSGEQNFTKSIHSHGIDLASKGVNGAQLYLNYAGIPVIGVYRWLNDRNLALLAEMRQEEAFTPAHQQVQLLLLIGLITAVISAIGVYLLAVRISRPVLAITKAAKLMAMGDLNQTAPVLTEDEVGVLATTLNQMARQLQVSFEVLENANDKLEHRVEERTLELKQANLQISALNQQLASENIRMSSELDITRRLQRMILPRTSELNLIEGLEIAGFMESANEVGGDYYDVLTYDGAVKIGIGDVTGHGLESGVLMIMVQTAVRTLLASHQTNPCEFLTIINRVIYDNVQRMKSDKNLSLSLLDYQAGTLQLSGQHEEVIVVQNGEIKRINTVDLGFPIGLEADIAQFVAYTSLQLQTGDVVVLYTDGITEAENATGILYGLDRLCAVIKTYWQKTAHDIKQAVITDVRQHIGKHTVFDDITLLVLKQK